MIHLGVAGTETTKKKLMQRENTPEKLNLSQYKQQTIKIIPGGKY